MISLCLFVAPDDGHILEVLDGGGAVLLQQLELRPDLQLREGPVLHTERSLYSVYRRIQGGKEDVKKKRTISS